MSSPKSRGREVYSTCKEAVATVYTHGRAEYRAEGNKPIYHMIMKEVPVHCQRKKKLCSISGNDDNFPISKFYLLETLAKLVFALFNVGLPWWLRR